ncbi:hypothetical protein [Helicobacter sp. T3_23-1059]
MKQKQKPTEFELQLRNVIYSFLSNNKKELGLENENIEIDLSNLSRELATTIYYFLKCKNIKV